MVMIKDGLTGKTTEFSIKYYKGGKLMVDTSKINKSKEVVDPHIYDCPQCGKHSMEEVMFAKSYGADDTGEPGLLCWVCHHMLSGDILEDYMTDEDGWREE